MKHKTAEQRNEGDADKKGRITMDKVIKRLANLLSVKSIVTLTNTAVFAYLSVTNQINQDFMTIYAVIIAFYFGTQSQKVQEVLENKDEGDVK